MPRTFAGVPKKGLTVHVDVNSGTYNISRLINKNYKRRLGWQVIFDPNLPKWDYLIQGNRIKILLAA